MTWGNNGAGPLGVQPLGPPNSNPNAGQMVGQGGAAYPPFYRADFESVMAAVSRGEISLNQVQAVGTQQSGNVAAGGSFAGPQGNPTLLHALSSALPQNGTNGLNGVAAGGTTVNASMASAAAPQNSPVQTQAGAAGGGVPVITPTVQMGVGAAAGGAGAVTANPQLANPIQYGGN